MKLPRRCSIFVRLAACPPLAFLLLSGATSATRAQSGPPASALQLSEALPAPQQSLPLASMEGGFHLLYELRFSEARAEFGRWEKDHDGEPLGPAAEAASYLFEEFHHQGVLTSEFFLDDKRLLGGIAGKPDRVLGDAFHAAVDRAQKAGLALLDRDPNDKQALFAMTMTSGMLADYSSLIEKRQLATLRLLGQSEGYAKRLLAVEPGAGDAYVALGASNYILGCLPAFKRFVLHLGGVHGDRAVGMRQLEIAAARGHYLQPYAELLLALASLREKQQPRARTLLAHLVAQYPENSLFALELAKLDGKISAASPAAVR
jgi:hypothetical protein